MVLPDGQLITAVHAPIATLQSAVYPLLEGKCANHDTEFRLVQIPLKKSDQALTHHAGAVVVVTSIQPGGTVNCD